MERLINDVSGTAEKLRRTFLDNNENWDNEVELFIDVIHPGFALCISQRSFVFLSKNVIE